jgi:hypothetical protein
MNAHELVKMIENGEHPDDAELMVRIGDGQPLPIDKVAFDAERGFYVATITLDLVTTSDIAARAGVSKALVFAWEHGTRGRGGFPAPYMASEERRGKVWAWHEVEAWLEWRRR